MAAPRLLLRVEREGNVAVSKALAIDSDTIRIGSNEANDVVLVDKGVSRCHCRIERGQRAWRLIDQDSLNGTRIGGVSIRDCDLPLPECRLEIVRTLGVGGMATVYLARFGEGGNSRHVAVKKPHAFLVTDPASVAALEDEARLGARIRHPNVVRVIDFVDGGGDRA